MSYENKDVIKDVILNNETAKPINFYVGDKGDYIFEWQDKEKRTISLILSENEMLYVHEELVENLELNNTMIGIATMLMIIEQKI